MTLRPSDPDDANELPNSNHSNSAVDFWQREVDTLVSMNTNDCTVEELLGKSAEIHELLETIPHHQTVRCTTLIAKIKKDFEELRRHYSLSSEAAAVEDNNNNSSTTTTTTLGVTDTMKEPGTQESESGDNASTHPARGSKRKAEEASLPATTASKCVRAEHMRGWSLEMQRYVEAMIQNKDKEIQDMKQETKT